MLARDSEQIQTETAVTALKQAPRRAAIAMFGLLLASYVINAMDRQLFPLLVPEVRRQYNFSLSDVGLLSTVFTLGMALAGLPTGYLLSHFSRKTVLQAGIALFSACTVLTVMAFGFHDMLIYRSATGVGEAMQLTILLAIAANYFASHRAAECLQKLADADGIFRGVGIYCDCSNFLNGASVVHREPGKRRRPSRFRRRLGAHE